MMQSVMMAQGINIQSSLLNDTIDEEDLFRMRDTLQLSRRNLAVTKPQVNALDYAVKDIYTPKSHTFDSHWYDHIYVGGGFGMEKIREQAHNHTFRALTEAYIFAGKDIDKRNSLRLTLGGAWGYQNETNYTMRQFKGRLDYLFNLSTHFQGYNPARQAEVSMMAGAGLTYSTLSASHSRATTPEVRAGLQFKFVTGPMGTINIEPYVGFAGDDTDLSNKKNWRRYDLFYGINVNYGFYLSDNLSKEARLSILKARLADERMVEPTTMERWRTPWFVEFSDGLVFANSPHLDFYETLGHQTSLSVGRWLSPVIGIRATATSRISKWDESIDEVTETGSSARTTYGNHYYGARVEAMLNPFGFSKSFKWNNPWGAYLLFGGELGKLKAHSSTDYTNRNSQTYDLGLHLYHRLSQDLQVFAEPRFTHTIYTEARLTDGSRSMNHINAMAIDLGLTVMIRSHRYALLNEMDDAQHYTYRNIKGWRVGLAGGVPLIQRASAYYSGVSTDWNAMVFAEYRFNHLHAARLQGDLLSLNGARIKTTGSQSALIGMRHNLLFTSLNYEVSLTNLTSGRFLDRPFELEAYIGPAIGWRVKTYHSVLRGQADESMRSELSAERDADAKKLFYGFDVGMKLSYNLGSGFTAFFSPTLYLMDSKASLRGVNTVGIGDLHMYQSLNLGVQYKIGSLHRNPEVMRRKHAAADRKWRLKQLKQDQENAERQQLRLMMKKKMYRNNKE